MPNKADISFPNGEWGNQKSKYPADSDQIGANDLTSGSKNYETHENGMLKKRLGSTEYSTISAIAKDQYEAIFNDGIRHLITVQSGAIRYTPGDGTDNATTNGTGFSTAANFEFATIFDRVYMGNGANPGQVYDKTPSYGGAAPVTVPYIKTMGAQVPSSAPTTALSGGGTGVPAGAHTWKVTFMYYDTEESNGSPASSPALTVPGGGQDVNLTAIPLGGYGVTSRKIYRDDNDGVYRLVGEVSDNTTTIFTDNVSTGTALIPTDNGVPPTFGLISSFLDRAWIAQVTGSPHTIYHSEAGFPDVFRSTGFVVCNERDPITATTVFLDRLVIFNRNSMGQILGRTSDEFRYSEIQSSVGCVDTRSIQTRIIQGVPHLVWLSDKGFYAYNGNSVAYLSEPIEDLVNLNIQQSVQTKGAVSQTSFAAPPATVTDGIDLTDSATITTEIPSKTWDDQADWEGGDSLSNIATKQATNDIKAVTRFTSSTSGQYSGNTVASSSPVRLQVGSDFTGELSGGVSATYTQTPAFQYVFVKIVPTKSGVINTLTFAMASLTLPAPTTIGAYATQDSGGVPNLSTLVTTSIASDRSDASLKTSVGDLNYPVVGGQTYWIGVQAPSWAIRPIDFIVAGSALSGGSSLGYNGSSWVPVTNAFGGATFHPAAGYTFTQDPIYSTGEYLSELYDSESDSIDLSTDLVQTASISAEHTITTTVEASNSIDGFNNLISPTTEHTVVDLNGSDSFTPSTQFRYWKIRVKLETTDDRTTPTVNFPELEFGQNAIWVSDSVHTPDATAYDSLTVASTVPGGTSLTTEIRTAATEGALSGASWVAFGSVSVDEWAQIRLTFDTGASNSDTPVVTSVQLLWTAVSTYTSASINTGTTPSGWDIFEADNTGTNTFYMKSAASSGALPGATWYAVTPGQFPTTSLPVLQYTQWKVEMTSTSASIPTVSSIAINWLISSVDPIRVASLFYDRHYYLAAAQTNSSTNDTVLVLDPSGVWRVWEDVNINTLSLFFNTPYYADAVDAKLFKLFEGRKDKGTDNIEFDVRTKAFDFSTERVNNRDKYKVMKDLVVIGKNTGATYTFYYSVDVGTTWTALRDDAGLTSFTTASDGERFAKRFKAEHALNTPFSGRTIMIRVVNNDTEEVELHKFKLRVMVRKGEPLG